jgi:hypothetical protein
VLRCLTATRIGGEGYAAGVLERTDRWGSRGA